MRNDSPLRQDLPLSTLSGQISIELSVTNLGGLTISLAKPSIQMRTDMCIFVIRVNVLYSANYVQISCDTF